MVAVLVDPVAVSGTPFVNTIVDGPSGPSLFETAPLIVP